MAVSDDRNPQAKEMADESMVRTLAAQAAMIWPQEQRLFERYGLSGPLRILDVGCGTGDVTHRIADLWPEAEVIGVDIVTSHLAEARSRYGRYGERLRFEAGDAFALTHPDAGFDLVVCRHMLQSVPDQHLVLRELMRVLKPGGRLHAIAEDYHMLTFDPGPGGAPDPDRFWLEGPLAFGDAIGTDLRVGRRMLPMLLAEGAVEVAVDYVVVDTLRVDRREFAAMMVAWRDGFAEGISQRTALSLDEVRAHFDGMIATLQDPERYAVWFVPVWSCRR